MGWRGLLLEPAVWSAGRCTTTPPDPSIVAPKEILVLRPNDLGDLLTTTPLFQALRRRFPQTRLVGGVGHWARPILEHNPFVDEIVTIDAPWNNKSVADDTVAAALRYIWSSPQVEALRRRGGFDVAIDVMGSHLGAALLMRLGARYRIGVRGYRGGWSACHRYIRFSQHTHVSQAALAQAALLGATELPEGRPQLYLTAAEQAEAWRLWGMHAPLGTYRVLVGCGAGLRAKTWPAGELAVALRDAATALEARGRPTRYLLVGAAADRDRAAEVLAIAGAAARSVCGATSLRATFALAQQADLVLTNPSMLLHVAAAFRRPTITVLGGPFVDAEAHDVLWGYPPPYRSVGASPESGAWPTARRVAQALVDAVSAIVPLSDPMAHFAAVAARQPSVAAL